MTVRSGEGAEGLTWKPSDFATSVKIDAKIRERPKLKLRSLEGDLHRRSGEKPYR
jgi:hypothetical protein